MQRVTNVTHYSQHWVCNCYVHMHIRQHVSIKQLTYNGEYITQQRGEANLPSLKNDEIKYKGEIAV